MPFLKKYFFTFDYNNKIIGFYNKNIEIPNNNPKIISKDATSKNKSHFGIIFIVLLLLSLLLIALIYLFLKKYLVRVKKISAIELESDNTNEKYSKYYNVELKQKTFFKGE